MGTVWILLLSFAIFVTSAPTPSKKLKYDQRQEGELNVRADLENFVVLIIPTPSSSSSPSNMSLMDFLSKSIPFPYRKQIKHNRNHHHHHQEENYPIQNKGAIEQFIESKTAPYHVDISKSRSHLAKLHPKQQNVRDETIIGVNSEKNEESPVLHPHQHERHEGRSLKHPKAYIVTIPLENDKEKTEGAKLQSSFAQKIDKAAEKIKLLLHNLNAAKENKMKKKSQKDEKQQNTSLDKKKKDSKLASDEPDKIKLIKHHIKEENSKEEHTQQQLFLLGTLREQCGPGLVRDSYGNCKNLPV